MEDDEDIQSHQSVGSGSRSGSHDSQRSNPRITVTVASAAPPQNTLTLALPIQQPRTVGGGAGGGSGGGSGGGGGREDCWSEGATAVLIDAWGERYLELSRGNLKQKHWKEVADIVSSRDDYLKAPKTDIQCKNRIDTVKKKYKLEKAKIAAGGGSSTWNFYDRLDQLIGPTATAKTNTASATPPLRSVPVGIPVGVRSAPVQSLRLKQQQERQQQQQLLQLQQQQQLRLQKQQQEQLKLQQQQRKRIRPPPAFSESSESEPEPSPDSPESDPYEQKRARIPFNARSNLNPNPRHQLQKQKGRESKEKNWGDSVRELTKAIMKFGEAYEHAESSKLQQMVEMQKQSMKFAKELELQRMQFFMKTQLELSQLKHSRRNVENNNSNHNHNHNHHSSNHNTINNNNHSDDSNN